MKNDKDNHDTWLDDFASKEIKIENGEIHVVEESEHEKKKHWLKNRLAIFGLAGLLLILIGWAVAGIFLSKIVIGDLTISAYKSDQALQGIIEQQATAYKLTIAYPDGSDKSFSLSDMGLSVDSFASVHHIRKTQHIFSSRLKWWQPIPSYLEVTSNNAKRDSFIAKQATVTIQPAKDATLAIKNGVIEITDSTPGKHYGLYAPIDTINAAVSTLQNSPLQLQTLSTRPAIATTQLAPYQAKLKNMLTQKVTFVIANKTFSATPDDIAEWIEISLNENGKKIDVTVNSGKVLSYIDKISAPFSDPAKAQVEFTRQDGTTAILFKGVEGTDVIDKSKIAADVATDLLDNKIINKRLNIDHASFDTIVANAYDKWIEVDLTKKQMYAYEQSSTVKSFLVSAGAPATPTVTGQYAIYSKLPQQDMRGLNVDGSSYFQPKVAWVNYFYKDYAIHGNYWRPLSWFGNINSSHGCVGLPDTEAQWIYSWAPIGTPVIIHT